MPSGVSLSTSKVTAGVGKPERPALAGALQLAASRPPDGLLFALASEPAPGWEKQLSGLTDFKAVVTWRSLGASGRGLLGAPFVGDHLGLALRWLACELADRRWRCACGETRTLGEAAARCACELPRIVELAGRQVVLPARLFPHHLGRALSFEAAPTIVSTDVADGVMEIDGVRATVRRASSVSSRQRDPVEPPLRALIDRCAACENALTPPVTHDPPDPRRFCGKCASGGLRCDFCMVPVTEQTSRWPDGRKACRECWTTAINDRAVLEPLVTRAKEWMTSKLGMNPGDCPVRFEDAGQIARLHGSAFSVQRGYTARPVGFYAPPPIGGPFIVIEHGTPRGIAYGVLVHELTHAWQFHHWPHHSPRTLVEGLAMWVEYQALLAEGAIHAARASERFGDAVYGLGFRVALSVEAKHGAEFVKHRLHELKEWQF
ncbi:MAG: basic secretory protein-like protein [Archangium sp.]